MDCAAAPAPWLAGLDATAAAPFRALQRPAFVLGRAAQSLDGFIAARGGASRWIGGPDDILHTHRLRTLCDAVLVGAGTVRADDPLLTVRACAGRSPVRVVVDPGGRLGPHHRVFGRDAPTLVVCADSVDAACHAETVRLPARADGLLSPRAMVDALAARGLHRILVEGGGRTLAAFLAAGVLDRLHVTVAPLLLGAGIAAFPVRPAPHPEAGLRLTWQVYALGADVLLDAALA